MTKTALQARSAIKANFFFPFVLVWQIIFY
jgi:hypothetical protein